MIKTLKEHIDETKVLEAIVENKTCGTIAKEFNTFKDVIRSIAHKHDVTIFKDRIKYNVKYSSPNVIEAEPIRQTVVNEEDPSIKAIRLRQANKTNKEIVFDLFVEDKSRREIASILEISPAMVQVYERQNSIYRHCFLASTKRKLVKLIKKDMEGDFSYGEIVERYNLTPKRMDLLCIHYDLPRLKSFYLRKRDDFIVSELNSGKDAETIIKERNKLLYVARKFPRTGYINIIGLKHGYRKNSITSGRANGECIELYSLMSEIEEMRDEQKMSFYKIARTLNDKGVKTILGATLSEQNIRQKYLYFKKDKEKYVKNVTEEKELA